MLDVPLAHGFGVGQEVQRRTAGQFYTGTGQERALLSGEVGQGPSAFQEFVIHVLSAVGCVLFSQIGVVSGHLGLIPGHGRAGLGRLVLPRRLHGHGTGCHDPGAIGGQGALGSCCRSWVNNLTYRSSCLESTQPAMGS